MSVYASEVLGVHTVTKSFKNPKDVIELAMVNGAGEILFHEYFDLPRKRRRKKSDPIDKIIEQEPHPVLQYSDVLKRIIKDARIIAAYPDNFHLAALRSSGFDAEKYCKKSVNVARVFADNFIEPDINDINWEDDEGKLHKRKLGTHPSYVTMDEAASYFSPILSSLGWGNAHDALWGAAASAFLLIEMSKYGCKGMSKKEIRSMGYELKDATDRYKVKKESSYNCAKDDSVIDVLAAIGELNLDYIDKRGNGGCLWVIGDLTLSEAMDELNNQGFIFRYKANGGKATKGSPAWWIK